MDNQETKLKAITPTDEELASLAKMGKQDAFDLLYERYFPTVYARVRFRVPEDEVEDVTQEVFIAVLKSLNSFRGLSKFSTWVWTVTNRKIADYYRSRSTNLIEQDNYQEQTDHDLPNHNRVAERHQDDLETIQQALCELPKNYQDILLMRLVDEMPFNEIARQNGQSLAATKSLFRRSVAALTRKMEGEENG
jgi:RNA polymerase sigma-70 factor (ECF subfamily)